MEDTYLYKGLRQKLQAHIKSKGIKDQGVLEAINKVPRHLFVESFLHNRAYNDEPLPIGVGQTISQPYTVAFQTELLQVEKGDKILEVGTGSGYQAAVLLELGAKVYTIERQRQLYNRTSILLPKIGYRPQFYYGDGYKGLPTYGPFNKIIVTAGAPFIPKDLLRQLTIGGRMVIPLGDRANQVMTLIVRKSEKEFEKKEYGNFIFVPLLKGTAN
ncbi:MAG: protein-L-isoaspartate O-methyltransferase [Bacteroidia bacterium]|nr:MAG: protein-L-isoaspartate O-methyltransferase [Bacteroidia bacterium]